MNGITVCEYLWIAWYLVWVVWAMQGKKVQKRESVPSRASYSLIILVAVWLMFFARGLGGWWNGEILPDTAWAGWTGLAITVLGFAITLWARSILGGNWSGTVTIKVEHELIRRGPYHWVRHPIYTGLIVAMAGTALALNEWRGLVAVLLVWIAFTIKRLKEEQFMRQTFGQQYVEYSQTTGAIFPRLLTMR